MIDLKHCRFAIWGFANGPYDTFSHIFEGMYRALKFLNREVIWVDAASNLEGIDWRNTFFISQNMVFARELWSIPLRDDCFYCVHNGFPAEVKPLIAGLDTLGFPVMWATDMLPPDIERNKPSEVFRRESKVINYVGSHWPVNEKELGEFERACQENGIELRIVGSGRGAVSIEENVRLVRESYMAPAIQGQQQLDVDYLPCRIYKNISYGQMGITNSRAVNDAFQGRLIFNPDPYQLFYDARERLEQVTLSELHWLMDFVAEKHTYINRLDDLLRDARLVLVGNP